MLDTRWDSPPLTIAAWLGRAPRIELADAAVSLIAAHRLLDREMAVRWPDID